MKTLLFCTAYANTLERWEDLHSRWINSVESGHLNIDKILIPDDGSPYIPEWEDLAYINESELTDQEPDERAVIYKFKDRLGRPSIYNQVGWYRSFAFAGMYAKKFGYQRVIHLEADAFLISKRIQDYMNNFTDGWESFWCPRHQIPETAIQVIAGENYINEFAKFWDIPYSKFEGQPPDPGIEQGESYLPYKTNRSFIGDRYGEDEINTHVPLAADYACQIQPTTFAWWLNN
jgi:hypothetical protein